MSVNPDDLFGGGDFVPSFNLKAVGDSGAGEVVSVEVQDQTDFNTGQPIVDQRTGQPKKQLKVILQSEHRGWDNVTSPPTVRDAAGHESPRDPSEDDGRRALFVKGWMIGAIGDAVRAAGESGAPKEGGKLAVRVTELVPSSVKGGFPYRKYEARYQPPAPQDAMFAAPQQAAAPQQDAAPQQAAPSQDPWNAPAQQAPAGDPWGDAAPF